MKNVLIITYYWPPAGGPGVQRVLKFTKLLPKFGWRPIILTVEDGDYPAKDESLVAKIPENCRVYRSSILEPYSLYRRLTGKGKDEKLPTFVLNENHSAGFKNKLATWARANVFIPDARIGWIPSGVKEGKRIIREENVDLIFASSPPHTVQLIAKRLSGSTGVPWVADFRDPWTEAFWSANLKKNPLSDTLDKRMERSVLSKADAVVTVSEGVKEMLGNKADNRYEVIQNGFEPIELNQDKLKDFRILFIGSLSNYQNPESLFKAVETLSRDIREQVTIQFVGRIFNGFDTIFEQYNHLNIEQLPYMPHRELMQFAQQAAVLFRPVAQSSYADKNVGAKTYDYLALRKPILTLGVKPSVSETMLRETGSGELFLYEDVSGISSFVLRCFEQWKQDGTTLLDNQNQLNSYSTEFQVERLAELFNEILDAKN